MSSANPNTYSLLFTVLTQTREGIFRASELGIEPSKIDANTPIDGGILFLTLECGLPILDVYFQGLIGVPASLVLRMLDDAILIYGLIKNDTENISLVSKP